MRQHCNHRPVTGQKRTAVPQGPERLRQELLTSPLATTCPADQLTALRGEPYRAGRSTNGARRRVLRREPGHRVLGRGDLPVGRRQHPQSKAHLFPGRGPARAGRPTGIPRAT